MIIITPYYGKKRDKNFENRQKYLLQALMSIDKQTVPNLTHIIVDDGSTDGFCNSIKHKFSNDNRIWLRREKLINEILTCTNAINFGIKFVLENKDKFKESESITFLHSDDLAIDLSIRESAMQNEDIDFIYTDALIFFDNNDYGFKWSGLPFNYKSLEENFWIKGKMPYHTMTWRIKCIKDLIDYNNKKYKLSSLLDPTVGCGEDVDGALTTIEWAKEVGANVKYIPQVTYGYRIHNQSLASIRNQRKRRKEENSVLYKHFGYFKTISLHLKRFIERPEIYINFLMKLKNNTRENIKFRDNTH